MLVRRVTCDAGWVRLTLEHAPRPEYGLISPLLAAVDGGLRARGGASALTLSGAVGFDIAGSTARAAFTLRAGEPRTFALAHASS